jgi:hypothetical protein
MDIDLAARTILRELRTRVEVGGEGAIYGDRSKALHDLDALLGTPSTGQARLLLAPTANLQELAMECGWGDEFNRLASELEIFLGIA